MEDHPQAKPSILVIGCGALAGELAAVVEKSQLEGVRVECLPAILHNRPEKIPEAVKTRIEAAGDYDQVYVAYGDCGTGGRLDAVLEPYGVERLPGAHCYQFYAGEEVFDRLHGEEPGTLYLTDFLARHFDLLIWRGLGLDDHPELREEYFGNYRRVVYLAQTEDRRLTEAAQAGAERLGLAFERHQTGYGELEAQLVEIARRAV